MRNLSGAGRTRCAIESIQAPDLPLTGSAWDVITDSTICVFGPSEDSSIIEIDRLEDGELKPVTSWEDTTISNTSSKDKILSVHFFPENSTICLVLANGDLVTINENPDVGASRVEIVGSIEGGILSASWSPDEEILAVLTASRNIVLMTNMFESISETFLAKEDLSSSQHVNVGWGKKETQFKGKRMASMRDPTVKDVEDGLLSTHDDTKCRISWRGDGAYLALSTVEADSRRVIRVYSREGVLDSVSEPVDYLEGVLSWRPSGNVVAGVRRAKEVIEVVFFERNGLRHGEFDLRIPVNEMEKTHISDLSWSSDSTVLAVSMTGKVQLWTMGNYHWYLKQELPLASKGHVLWHPEKNLRLGMCQPGVLSIYNFVLRVNAGSTKAPYDYGMVCVIDGDTLKITPLKIANVPPPMSFKEIQLSSPIVDVGICEDGSTLAVLRHAAVDIIKWNWKTGFEVLKDIISANTVNDRSPRQICFADTNTLCILGDQHKNASHIEIHTKTGHDTWTFDKLEERVEGILSLVSSRAISRLLVVDMTGNIEQLSIHSGATSKTKLPERCSWVEVYSVEDKDIIFSLSDSGKLFANQTKIAQGCTSFFLTSSHLIFTTSQNLLKFVNLTTNEADLQIPSDETSGDGLCRAIERGARLVSVIPSTFAVVLQMPRGNLETIFPRALVLSGIRQSIDNLDYKTAFLSCRSHRVDFNILHDHNSQQFMSMIKTFIDQIDKISYIDLFLSQISNENVMQTMFTQAQSQDSTPAIPDSKITESLAKVTTKVNDICDAFLSVLSLNISRIQNTITAHVCKQPPDLDSALLLITKLREQDVERAEEAIEHVCFLCDVNKLYDNALGLYNLDLVLLIAQQSQRDPREYLPFVQSIQEMKPERQKFFLDNHLKRYVKAVTQLYIMGDEVFDEMSEYTVKHELYKEVLALCRYNEPHQNTILRLYSKYLESKSNYKEAAVAYEYLGSFDLAVEAYRRGGLWQEALYAAAQVPLSEIEVQELGLSLAEDLVLNKNFQQAARIHLDYRKDLEEAARTLCKGFYYEEAMRIVVLHGKTSLVDEIIDLAIVDGFNTISELLADCKGQIQAQVTRIRELRVKKEEDPLAYFSGMAEEDTPDNMSLAPTDASTRAGGSVFTRYTDKTPGTLNTMATRKTKKNTRREERKKARGKKGSVYEEDYLIASVGRLIDRIESHRSDILRLVQTLLRRGMRERASAIQSGVDEVFDLLNGCSEEVFGSAPSRIDPNMTSQNLENGMDEKLPGRSVPIIKRFESLSII